MNQSFLPWSRYCPSLRWVSLCSRAAKQVVCLPAAPSVASATQSRLLLALEMSCEKHQNPTGCRLCVYGTPQPTIGGCPARLEF